MDCKSSENLKETQEKRIKENVKYSIKQNYWESFPGITNQSNGEEDGFNYESIQRIKSEHGCFRKESKKASGWGTPGAY